MTKDAPVCPPRTASFAGGSFVTKKRVDCHPGAKAGTSSCNVVDAETSVAPFCLDETEVTVEDFRACVRAGKCEGRSAPQGAAHDAHCNYPRDGREKHPMNCVDWNQADAFCRAAGSRLPTSAEWEWAARGGGKEKAAFPYPWGTAAPSAQACWSGITSRLRGAEKGTCPVGSFDGDSVVKVHDLAANVDEWVANEDRGNRVIRGGHWASDKPIFVSIEGDLATAQPPTLVANTTGFRCAKTPGH